MAGLLIPFFAGLAGAAEAPGDAAARASPSTATASSTAPAGAAAPATTAPVAAAERSAPRRPGRFFLHVNMGFNVFTHLDATGDGAKGNANMDIVPGDRPFDRRFILLEQVGAGYWVHPQLRLTLTLQFGETLSGIPGAADKWSVFGIIPWLAWTHPSGFYAGAGPLLAPRSYGDWNKLDAGLFTCLGYALALGRGFSLSLAAQVPLMFVQRFSVAVTPALALGYRL